MTISDATTPSASVLKEQQLPDYSAFYRALHCIVWATSGLPRPTVLEYARKMLDDEASAEGIGHWRRGAVHVHSVYVPGLNDSRSELGYVYEAVYWNDL